MLGHPPSARARASSRVLTAVVAITVVLSVGCSRVPSNTPEGYGDTLEDGTTIVQANFMGFCVDAQNDGDVVASSAEELCGCIYQLIVDEVPFARFQEYDQQLEDDPTDLPAEYQDFADRCADGDPGESAGGESDATTTTAGGE